MTRKVCVITGTRAEYGLLRWVMQGIKDDPELNLQVVATGMHLSPEFGLTYQEIENDGFYIDRKVEMLISSDTAVGIGKSMGLGLIGFADVLDELRPDIIIVLGDRYEILSAVAAALVARIPVAHLHGGESTVGAFDDAIRHSITKMSHMHFVAAEDYRKRVIQLGENPDYVFLVGALGLDNIEKLHLMDRGALEESLGFELLKKNLLITFHPVTLEDSTAVEQMNELLSALETLDETRLIFTMPNADTGSRALFKLVDDFAKKFESAHVFTSLGQLRYLSCLKYVDGVIGNSSSGVIEMPSFGKGTINIGDRQNGRLKAESVIDCNPDRDSIIFALKLLYSEEAKNKFKNVRNPYGEAGASDLIVQKIRNIPLETIIKKPFYDVVF